MFRLDLVILRPMLTFVLPDTVHTLGSHRVYIRRIHLVKPNQTTPSNSSERRTRVNTPSRTKQQNRRTPTQPKE